MEAADAPLREPFAAGLFAPMQAASILLGTAPLAEEVEASAPTWPQREATVSVVVMAPCLPVGVEHLVDALDAAGGASRVRVMHVGQNLCRRSADPLSLGVRCCGQRGIPQCFMAQQALTMADPLLSGPKAPICRYAGHSLEQTWHRCCSLAIAAVQGLSVLVHQPY